MHAHARTHMRVHICTYTHAYVNVHTRVKARAHTRTHTRSRALAHACTHIHVHTCMSQTSTHVHIHTDTHTNHTYTHTHTHARTHTHTHTHTRTHIHTYTHKPGTSQPMRAWPHVFGLTRTRSTSTISSPGCKILEAGTPGTNDSTRQPFNTMPMPLWGMSIDGGCSIGKKELQSHVRKWHTLFHQLALQFWAHRASSRGKATRLFLTK